MNDDSTVEVERGPFEMVPHWILLSPDLSALAVRLYLLLRKYADAKGDCFPSRQKLASLLGVGVPTLDRARKQLISAGAITVSQRRGPDDRWLTSLYRVHWHPRIKLSQGLGSEMIQACIKTDALTQTHLRSQTQDQDLDLVIALPEGKQAEAPAGVTPNGANPEAGKALRLLQGASFEAFWQAYPRRVGKKAARDAYQQAIQQAEPEVILAAAKRYAADPNREDQFTAHPTTWLRQGRWEDDPLPARSQQKVGGQRRMDQYAEIHARIQQTKRGIRS